MEREIKFRAWDTVRKIFVPQGEIVFADYGDNLISVIPNDTSYIGDDCHNGEPQRGRFIVSQFTGLKDKNGVEIYEGDIVKTVRYRSSIDDIIETVVFKDGSFCTECQYDVLVELSYHNKIDIEVIGNIHQNPELI